MPIGGDEAGAAERRVRVGDVRVGLDLALGDRRLADELDRPRGQRGLVVGEERAGAGLGDGAVDGEDQRCRGCR